MERDRHIYHIYGKDALDMTIKLMEAADIASRIPGGPDAKICMKPNLVVAARPETGATTHTGVLEGVIQYLQAHGFKNIDIIEGSWVGDSTRSAFSVTGYDRLAKKYGVGLYDLKSDHYTPKDSPIGKINVCDRALSCDYLINLPVLKGHCQTVMTCALKNMKGCLPDREKRRFHSLGLTKPIAALNTILKPDVNIVDSICGDINFEEGGNPVYTNRMMLNFDSVQMDAYGCELMGIDIHEPGYVTLAEKYGAGKMEHKPEDMIYVNDPSAAPPYPKNNRLASQLTRNVDQRSACSACYGMLVHALYHYKEEYGRNYPGKISIGQEFKGQMPEGIGIGNCCKCAAAHVPGCPPKAADILKMLEEQ